MLKLPGSLLKDLRSVNGFDEDNFVRAHEQNAITSVRLHPLKSAGIAFGGNVIPWCNSGIYLDQRPVFTLDPAFHGGAYYVQEASSMFLEHMWKHLLTNKNGLRVLDLCAAPGGKSTLIASLLSEDSLLISNEVIRSRATVLEENMIRWGYTNSWVTCNDPRDFTQLKGYFDVIVIDAPCSGSGLFRKDHKALDEWSENSVAICSARQQRILADVWPALKKDGILIYATCSFSPQEDEDILDWLAEEYNAQSVDIPVDADWGIVPTTSMQKGMAGYRFFPGKVRGEGFFTAAVRKTYDEGSLKLQKSRPANMSKIQQQAAHLMKRTDLQYIQTNKDGYNAILPEHEIDWNLLNKLFYLRKAGLSIGSPAQKEWLPAHDIALSIDASHNLPAIQVNKEQALKFLKREEMNIDNAGKGWQVIKFNNIGLGWVKSLENRMNNYLPKHWRIRMEIPDDDAI